MDYSLLRLRVSLHIVLVWDEDPRPMLEAKCPGSLFYNDINDLNYETVLLVFVF